MNEFVSMIHTFAAQTVEVLLLLLFFKLKDSPLRTLVPAPRRAPSRAKRKTR